MTTPRWVLHDVNDPPADGWYWVTRAPNQEVRACQISDGYAYSRGRRIGLAWATYSRGGIWLQPANYPGPMHRKKENDGD